MSKERKNANKVERHETDPANPANPATGLRFPKAMPWPWYRDPGETVAVSVADVVVCELPVVPVATSADIAAPCRPLRAVRDRYYTMARRVRVRQAMTRGAR